MSTVVAAIGLVSEARSKIVAVVTGLDAASKVSAPKAPAHTMSRRDPTSAAAAGKTRAAMARSITARASSSDTTHHGAHCDADGGAHQHIPGPGQTGEFMHTNHRH